MATLYFITFDKYKKSDIRTEQSELKCNTINKKSYYRTYDFIIKQIITFSLFFSAIFIISSCYKNDNQKENSNKNYIRIIYSPYSSIYQERIYNCHCKEPGLFTSGIINSNKDTVIYNQILIDYISTISKKLIPNYNEYECRFFNCCFRAFVHFDGTVICICLGFKGCKINQQLMIDSPLIHLILKYYSGFYSFFKQNSEIPLKQLPEIKMLINHYGKWQHLN